MSIAPLPTPRRIVVGLNEQGRSCVQIDGPTSAFGGSHLVWRTEAIPADNAHPGDCPAATFNFDVMHSGGSIFMVMDFSPNAADFWHATDTIDYIVLLQGEVTLATQTGEVTLKAGDFLVDRGIVHSWRNTSGAIARAAIILLPAHPVGKGRTV